MAESWKNKILNEKEPGRSSFVAAIIANIILFYIVNQIYYWNLSFVSSTWINALWALNLSLEIGIIGNIILLIYHPLWFRSLIKVVMNLFVILAAYVLYNVFPFTFSTPYLGTALEIALIILIIIMIVATLVELAKFLISIKK